MKTGPEHAPRVQLDKPRFATREEVSIMQTAAKVLRPLGYAVPYFSVSEPIRKVNPNSDSKVNKQRPESTEIVNLTDWPRVAIQQGDFPEFHRLVTELTGIYSEASTKAMSVKEQRLFLFENANKLLE